MNVSWIKLSTAMFADEKIKLILDMPEGHSVVLIWLMLLTLAGQKNMGGEIFVNDETPYTAEMLATLFSLKPGLMRLALKTFEKFRMIEVLADGTIVISNWAKHQNLEGLEKIRQQNAERKRRQRERNLEKRMLENEERAKLRNSPKETQESCHVTVRDSVTQDSVTHRDQSRREKKRELPPPVPHRGTEADVLDYSEAKQWLNDLFGRQRAWTEDEEELLEKLVPISSRDQKLIQWGYSLYRDDEGWAMEGNSRLSKPKHNLIGLLREFGSELDKWCAARKQAGLSPTMEDPPQKKEPPMWREVMRWVHCPDVVLPNSFWELDRKYQEQYEREFQTFVKATGERQSA